LQLKQHETGRFSIRVCRDLPFLDGLL